MKKIALLIVAMLLLSGCGTESIPAQYFQLNDTIEYKKIIQQESAKLEKVFKSGNIKEYDIDYQVKSAEVIEEWSELNQTDFISPINNENNELFLLTMTIRNHSNTDYELNIGNQVILCPETSEKMEDVEDIYEIQYFNKHGEEKSFYDWKLLAGTTEEIKVGYFLPEDRIKNPNLLLSISPYGFSRTDEDFAFLTSYYHLN